MESPEGLQKYKDIYDSKELVINGRSYRLTKTTHAKRLKVFSFSTALEREGVSFFNDPMFVEVEGIINNIVLYDGELISKRKEHWDDYPEDYVIYITHMVVALSYPFLKGLAGV